MIEYYDQPEMTTSSLECITDKYIIETALTTDIAYVLSEAESTWNIGRDTDEIYNLSSED